MVPLAPGRLSRSRGEARGADPPALQPFRVLAPSHRRLLLPGLAVRASEVAAGFLQAEMLAEVDLALAEASASAVLTTVVAVEAAHLSLLLLHLRRHSFALILAVGLAA